MAAHKDRSNNFTQIECTKLKDLLEKYPIILTKKTDCASNKQKDEAWGLLSKEFNEDNSIYRTKKQLIYKFNNMKKLARKELSYDKKERCATGGGPPPPKPSDTSEWLYSIMKESIVGLPSVYDSDTSLVTEQNDIVPVDTEIVIHELEYANVTSGCSASLSKDQAASEGAGSEILDKIEIHPAACNEENVHVKEIEEPQFDTSTPKAMLRQPVSKALSSNKLKRKLATPLETRKRIISMTEHKEDYLKTKSDRDQMLKACIQEEHQQNLRHKQELHELEIEFKKKYNNFLLEKVQLEIEVEKEKIKKLKMEQEALLNKK